MTGSRLPNRPDSLDDLTRWNRAGLRRFDYIDGDAATWLEEIRLALLGLYLRGGDFDTRTPERWRDLYLVEPDALPDPEPVNAAAARVAWARLATQTQTRPESRGRRTERLLAQYAANTGDLGWETMRAFSRATHVLLGHLNAYANEGYLRTATQWDNLRRLAAMVNYQPTPPASASTTVSLTIKPESGPVAVSRGVPMKYAPPEGGAPLIFETLETVNCHEALNAARVEDWDVNDTTMDISGDGFETDPADDARTPFLIPEKAELAPGDLAVVTDGTTGVAATIAELARDDEAATVKIAFAELGASDWNKNKHTTRLMIEPDAVIRGMPRTDAGKGAFFIEVESVAGFQAGDVILIDDDPYQVSEVFGSGLRIETGDTLSGEVTIKQLAPLAMEDGEVVAPLGVTQMYFPTSNGVEQLNASGGFQAFFLFQMIEETGQARARAAPTDFAREAVASGGSVEPAEDDVSGVQFGWRYKPATKVERGFAVTEDQVELAGKVMAEDKKVIPGLSAPATKSVRFEGKPPKGLAAGTWFVARNVADDALTALQVTGIRTGAGDYTVLFAQSISEPPEDVEFHGPMTRALAPEHWNRSPAELGVEVADLIGIPGEARALLKPGRAVLLTRDGTTDAIQGTLTEITDLSAVAGRSRVRIEYTAAESSEGWTKGEAAFHLNTTTVSHGETKGQKTLGSGDGERTGQSFLFPVGKVSHVPATIAESGVIPDIDVAVNGEVWPYADFIDPAAEGTKTWSTTLTEDGFLRVNFRRRLPTGSNNVTVQRHRVGVGARGTGIPAFSFVEPMKKHRHVTAIVQPFETSGGADREAVSALRESTPSRLAANGRAVSLADFERLARRQSSILRARAVEIPETGAARHVRLTLVPEKGAALTPTLESDLRPVIASRSIPGVRLSFKAFESVYLQIGARIRVDLSAFDRTEVKAAAQDALYTHFALEARDFGQAAHRAEILAALETVTGVETAVVTKFHVVGLPPDRDPNLPPPPGVNVPRRIARRDGAIAAIFPEDDQVAYVRAPGTGHPENTIEVVVEDAFGEGAMNLEFDDLRTKAGRILYRELPEEYRFRDHIRAGESGDLEAYLHGFGHLLDLVRATIEQAHADSFAEPVDFTVDPDTPAEARRVLSIQPWLIPYLADLVGADLLAPDPVQRTKELNSAVTWYKSKGTLQSLDEVGDIVGGTETVAREGWRHTLICPRIGLPPFTVPKSEVEDPLGAALPPLGTPDLRRPDRAVRDPSGASPLFRLRYPTRDPATGLSGPIEEIHWKPRRRGGAPCFPGAYDDGMARCPDLRDPATVRDPGPHPRRTIVHVRTPDGMFEDGLLRLAIGGGTELLDAGERIEGWSRVGPAQILRAKGMDELAETPPDKVVVELSDTATVPNRARLLLQNVLVVGAGITIETGGRVRAERAAIESVTIEQAHDRRTTPSLEAEECLFDRITSLSGWAELVHCTVLGDVSMERLHASDCIFAGDLSGLRCETRTGRPLTCIRYSRVPPDAEARDCATAKAPTNTGRKPHFVQRYFPAEPICALRTADYGEPGAGVLDTLAPRAIRQGAEDEGEMGAHHHLFLGAALTALERKLADFLPLGQEIALRYDPLMAERPPRIAST